MSRTITVLPIDQEWIEICCEETCVRVRKNGSPAGIGPAIGPVAGEKSDDFNFNDPGVIGVLPSLMSNGNRNGFLSTCESWEELDQIVRNGKEIWHFLSGSTSHRSSATFLVRGGDRVQIAYLRHILADIPYNVDITIGLAPRSDPLP